MKLIVLFSEHLNLHLIRRRFYRLQCFLHLIQYLTLSSRISCNHCYFFGLLLWHLSFLELVIQSVSEVWTISEVVESPLPGWHPVEASVKILEQPYHYVHSSFVDFSLCPCKFLTHAALPTQNF